MRKFSVVGLTFLFCGAVGLPLMASAKDIRVPGHRAVYVLSAADSGDGPSTAKGRYVFDVEDFCDGYTLNERLVVQLERRGTKTLTDYRLSAFESETGDLYRFSTETSFNGRTGNSAEGTLSVGEENSDVDYKTAEDVEFEGNVLAPMAHLRALLEAASEGETRHAAQVFDGDIDKPVFFAVTRLVKADEDIPDIEGADALDGVPHWKIDAVFYSDVDGEEEEDTPDFSFTGVIYATGVMTNLVFDYGEFALDAALEELEVYDSDCEETQ